MEVTVKSAKQAARIFKILSVDTRVRMIELLKENSLCVNALSEALKITPAAVSQHLRILRDADIVIAEKRGYYVHYQVKKKTLTAWSAITQKLLQTDQGNNKQSS